MHAYTLHICTTYRHTHRKTNGHRYIQLNTDHFTRCQPKRWFSLRTFNTWSSGWGKHTFQKFHILWLCIIYTKRLLKLSSIHYSESGAKSPLRLNRRPCLSIGTQLNRFWGRRAGCLENLRVNPTEVIYFLFDSIDLYLEHFIYEKSQATRSMS